MSNSDISHPQGPQTVEQVMAAFNAAIAFAVENTVNPAEFLQLWRAGLWTELHRAFPDWRPFCEQLGINDPDTLLCGVPPEGAGDVRLHLLVNEARTVLGMVDTNNRVRAGENRRAWHGEFVEAAVHRLLSRLDGQELIERSS